MHDEYTHFLPVSTPIFPNTHILTNQLLPTSSSPYSFSEKLIRKKPNQTDLVTGHSRANKREESRRPTTTLETQDNDWALPLLTAVVSTTRPAPVRPPAFIFFRPSPYVSPDLDQAMRAMLVATTALQLQVCCQAPQVAHLLWLCTTSHQVHPHATLELACKPKNQGGLGILNLAIQNEALLKNLDKYFNMHNLPWVDLV